MRNSMMARWLAVAALAALCGCSHSSTRSAANPALNPGDRSAQTAPTSAPAPPPPAPAPVVIAAGKILTVTLDQNISTKDNRSGDPFRASLAEPVRIAGQTVLPPGTKAVGTVVEAKSAGHLKGGAVLALSLDGLTIHGQKYSIRTSEYQDASKGRGKRSLVGGGGGAALGAVVGAIAGGGKGAAIGALAGGGAGTAGAAFTGQRDITLRAETRLHFRLERRLVIQP